MDSFLEKYILLFFRFFRISHGEATVRNLIQFIKFGIVGVTNSIVSYLINIGVILALKSYKLHWDYLVGNMASFGLSVLWSFYWNSRFVFVLEEGQKRNLWSSLLKTYASYAFTGLVLNNILSYLWIDVVRISKMVSPLINMIIGIPINFMMNKLWAFRSEKSRGE